MCQFINWHSGIECPNQLSANRTIYTGPLTLSLKLRCIYVWQNGQSWEGRMCRSQLSGEFRLGVRSVTFFLLWQNPCPEASQMKNLSWLTVGEKIATVEGNCAAGGKACIRRLSSEGVCESSHPFLLEQKAESGQEMGLIYEGRWPYFPQWGSFS